MKNEIKQQSLRLRDFLIESKFPRNVANDFKDLFLFSHGGKRLSKEKDRRFRDKKILTRGNKINISDTNSGIDWIMLGLYYQDILPELPQETEMKSARKTYPKVRNIQADGKQGKQ